MYGISVEVCNNEQTYDRTNNELCPWSSIERCDLQPHLTLNYEIDISLMVTYTERVTLHRCLLHRGRYIKRSIWTKQAWSLWASDRFIRVVTTTNFTVCTCVYLQVINFIIRVTCRGWKGTIAPHPLDKLGLYYTILQYVPAPLSSYWLRSQNTPHLQILHE